MTGKAKPKKHTASETARKTQLATKNMGGGAAGLQDRMGGQAGHSRYVCTICMTPVPDLKTMRVHYEARHPMEEYKDELFEDLHEKFGGTTRGVAVHGSLKKDRNSKK